MTLLRILAAATTVASALLIAACGKDPAPAATASAAPAASPASASSADPAQQQVSIDDIQSQTQGFIAGQPMSARTVYVFFDAECPHCAALWYAAKPLKAQAKFVWIPIRLLRDESETQGAAILAAKDGAAAMDEHEASMQDRKGGIKPEGDVSAQRAAVQKNTALFNKYGFSSVPTLVTKNPQTGAVVTHEGALPTPDLAAFLGVPPPSK